MATPPTDVHTHEDRLQRAKLLAERGVSDYAEAEAIDAQLMIRQRAANACESVYRAFMDVCDVLIDRAGRSHDGNDSSRIEALRDIGRRDLGDLCSQASFALHHGGYIGQRMGRNQRDAIRRLADAVERELAKLA